MAVYQHGNHSEREKPWRARVEFGWSKSDKRRVHELGYFRTRAEAEAAEDAFRKQRDPQRPAPGDHAPRRLLGPDLQE